MKISRPHTGKKNSLPSVEKKAEHIERSLKKALLNHLKEDDWQQELINYNMEISKHATRVL